MPRSCLARLTPSHAAALNERSFLPPISKTIPTLILQPSRLASACWLHEEPSSDATSSSNKTGILIFITLNSKAGTPNSFRLDRRSYQFSCLWAFLSYFIRVSQVFANGRGLRLSAAIDDAEHVTSFDLLSDLDQMRVTDSM